MMSENKEKPGALAGATGFKNTVKNTPLHDTTPEIIMQGRWVIINKKPDGWHIVLIEDDVFHLLRVLAYGKGPLAQFHALAFAKHYGAQYGGRR